MPILATEEKLDMLKVAPATDYELECVGKLKPRDYEVYLEWSNNVLDEAMEIFTRSGRAMMLISGDCIVSLLSAQGDVANASCGSYLHQVIQPIITKYILKYYQENPGIKEGDIWFSNDALYGGIHNPDEVALMPIFYEGELIAWAGALVHTTETGACEPGGMPVTSKSRFEEGMNFPPIKIGENFRLRDDLMEVIVNAYGMRHPRMLSIDIRARGAAIDRVRTRLQRLAKEKGKDFVVGLIRKMLMVAEEGARRKIMSWPDGKYRSVHFGDAVGFQEGLVRSCYMTLTKKGDKLTFDWTGSSPETPLSYNSHSQSTIGHASNFMYEYIFHDLPIGNATFQPIDWVFPPNSCINPSERAATSCSVMIATGTMSAMHNVFGKMIYCTDEMWMQAGASNANAGNALVLAGLSQWGAPFADMFAYQINSEGQGGLPQWDGGNAFGFPWCIFGRCPEIEYHEVEYPLLILSSQHWKDSCGFGKFRGGSGTAQIWVAYHVPMVFFMSIADNVRLPTAQPLFGGYAPCAVVGISVRNADILEKLARGDKDLVFDFQSFLANKPVKGDWTNEFYARTTTAFNKGDIITIAFSTGGAGFGDPLQRNPELVMNDLRDQLISDWVSSNVYKVVYDPARLRVDYEKTDELRRQEREERKKRGRPYAEFEKEWSLKKPPEEILGFYGSWPDAKVVTPIFRP